METRYGERVRKIKDFMRGKLFVVVIVIIVLISLLIGRLVYINTVKGETYAKRVLSQSLTYVNTTMPYARGTIYDRNGVVLAQSTKVYNVILDPKVVLTFDYQVDPTLDALVEVFGFDRAELEKILKEQPESQYVVLKKQESFSKVNEFNEKVEEEHKQKRYIKGVWFEEEFIREYPAGSVASHVIGFTNKGNVGSYGIEQYYNDELNGIDGKEYGYYDSELNAQTTIKEPTDGNNIVSTIDYNIQTTLEKYVREFNEETGANNIGVIIMNPNNGEILAMASNEEFDLNNPRSLSAFYTESELNAMSEEEKTQALYDIWKNFCVNSSYEPGSTFKTVTVASALEEDLVYSGSTFECQGYEEIGGWHISCNNLSGHGVLNLTESLMKSCNCALMNIASRLGSDEFYRYQKNFGFGSKTGIDLVGESSGIVISKENLNETELATSSFGTTFNVSMVQMAAAYCSIINGGSYYRPHVVKEIVSSDGATAKSFDNELLRKTVSPETSSYIRQALYMTVEEGTATPAKVDGYLIGGKTGTAQKRPKEDKKYVVSFAGFAPADDPEVFMYVVMDEIHDEELKGSSKPATSFTSKVFADILPYLGIYPSGDIQYNVNLDIIPASEKSFVVGEGEDVRTVEYDPSGDEGNPDVLPDEYEDEEDDFEGNEDTGEYEDNEDYEDTGDEEGGD